MFTLWPQGFPLVPFEKVGISCVGFKEEVESPLIFFVKQPYLLDHDGRSDRGQNFIYKDKTKHPM